MSKLTNAQLIELYEYAIVGEQKKLPDGISNLQYRSFFKYYDLGDTKNVPAYMITFLDLAMPYGNSVDDLLNALDDLQDSDTQKPISAGAIKVPDPDFLQGRKFVFTSAQNNTDVHTDFLKAIQIYCEHNDAELVIGKYVYNINGFQNGVQDDSEIYYDPALSLYFHTEKVNITDDLVWCGDLNILPTAKNPISGFETYTGTKSCIIPHAKIALESMATPKKERAKMIYATGTVTLHNYIQKKAGQIAQHAHCYGALIVEIDQAGEWFARQIQTDESGSFYDLNTLYNPDGIEVVESVSVINWGDLHAEKSDQKVLDCCKTMINDLKPLNQVFHDTFDMTARNHHNRQSGHFLAKMHYNELESVLDDLRKTEEVLKSFITDYDCDYHIIESNHDLALENWLNSNDYDFKKDPINALTYLCLQSYVYKDLLEYGEMPNILKYALTDYLSDTDDADDMSQLLEENFYFYNVDDSVILAGVECGLHGHVGANGSRGSPAQFQKLNRPVNTGHTHTASIKGSVYTAGVTGSLDQGYNKGASSWSHSHILTYENGMRSIITMKPDQNGVFKYRA